MFIPSNCLIHRFPRLIILATLSLLITTGLQASDKGADTEMETLRQEVATLKERIETLEAQLSAIMQLNSVAPDPGNTEKINAGISPVRPETTEQAARDNVVVTTADNSAINVGGRLKIDAIYNSRSTGGNSGTNASDLAFSPASIPVTATGEHDQLSFNARQTRLWLKGYSPSDYGEMAGYIEIDFNASSSASNERVSNSYTPRLRHAYGNVGGLTLGQTYTTFMNVSAFPEINDLNGPVGIMNIRQPLLRYHTQSDSADVYLALENPETTLTTSSGSRLAPDDDRLPDLVGKVEFTGDWGNWSLAGMARQIRHDSNTAAMGDDSTWGGAVSAAGRIRLGRRDNLRFSLSYGNTLGRYISYNAINDGVITDNGEIELTEMIGGYLAWQHWWKDDLRSTFAAGFASADHSPAVNPSLVNEKFYSTHLNLIWNPSLNSSIGIEWLHGYRELGDGRDGHLNRIQITSMYNF